ncbi:MAG: type I DNA topoisomerase [Anaerolineales bacterium]|nr:type I DNA topoisomerase [Anaerolineales bacterium]
MSSEELIGYCLKCKEKRPMLEATAEWAANGSPGTRGKCPVCGGTIYKQGRTAAHEDLPKPLVTAKRPPSDSKSKGKKSTKSPKSSVARKGEKLVIVESPTKAKTIGRYLGRGYIVKSSSGHIRDLLKSRLSVDVENDFAPEYRVPNEKRALVKELKKAAAQSSEIYLATDPDREGEAIAWHVMEAAEMDPARVKRVVFQEITPPAIRAAFEQPRAIDMDRVEAQQARRVLDRLVGYQLSPLLWRKIHGRLSAGRVQSVAVRMVVEREREIDAFTSVEYWTIDAELSQPKFRIDPRGNGSRRPFFLGRLHRINGEDPVLDSEKAVEPHLEALKQASWEVGNVNIGTRTRRPSAPFTTSTLQQEASRRLGLGTNRTMRIAQELYEGIDTGEGDTGLITYMRTDSVTVAGVAQDQAREFVKSAYGPDYLPEKPPVYKTRSKTAQEAHEAVRPTSVERTPAAMKPHLSKDQYRLYKLIWERFVASQMAPALYDTVSAEIWAGPETTPAEERPYLFRASGSTLTFRGFLAVYGTEDPDEEDEENTDLPQIPSDLQAGEPIDLLELLPEQHFTQPPPRFSEASLVKALEEHEIGRPSTYASIISTIQNRGYVEQEQKRLHPTEIGAIVNDMLVQYFPDVVSVDFTARMEDELDGIADGKPWVPVIDEFYQQFATNLAKADEALPKLDIRKEPELVGRDCPQSGHPLVYREGRYGRFIGCSHYPHCRYTEQILVKVGVTCPKCGGDLIEKRSKRGRLFYGCSNYPDCDWTNWKRPLPQPCPVCGGVMVQENKETAKCTVCEHVVHLDPTLQQGQPIK